MKMQIRNKRVSFNNKFSYRFNSFGSRWWKKI